MSKTESSRPSDDHPPLHSEASDSAVRERGKLIVLMRNLETALAAASFKRADNWNKVVQDELLQLQLALRDSRLEINSTKGLFAEIAADYPFLISRIEKLKQEYSDLERQIETLREQFKNSEQVPEVGDIRERLSWLLNALRHAQVKENELVFEAVGRDLGGGD